MRTIDLARALGLSEQQVRSHETWGFLPPVARSTSGYRLFTEHHLSALKTARALIAAGYSWPTALRMMQAVHSKDLDTALALVDERHAELHRKRCELNTAVEAMQTLVEHTPKLQVRQRQRGLMRVSAAAKAVGVRPSAVRFWEQQGLLQPERDENSGYRLYDQRQMRRLEIVALLRGADYSFDVIRSVLDELAEGRRDAAMRTLEQRRRDLAQASCVCAEATATLWEYTNLGASSAQEDMHSPPRHL